MKTVSDALKEAGFRCLLHEKRCLDDNGSSEYADYDQRIKGALFEDPTNDRVKTVSVPGIDEKTRSPLTYFMDGSRRVFRFSDIVLPDGRYYPLLAGQAGVAVLKRSVDGAMSPLREYVQYRNILIFPDTVDQADQQAALNVLSKHMDTKFIIKVYETRSQSHGGTSSEDYINKGTKKILDTMHDMELEAVAGMMNDRLLGESSMLVVDGSLQFRRDVLKRKNFLPQQLRNVIGISKSFTPSQPVDSRSGGRHLGTMLEELKFKQRTPVFKAGYDSFQDVLGVWYLRLRRREERTSPLQGVIKIEVLADSDYEQENGISGHRVDTLSAYILSERNVTPYGTDARWANHLYPIFLTEGYLKSGFLSDIRFKGLL